MLTFQDGRFLYIGEVKLSPCVPIRSFIFYLFRFRKKSFESTLVPQSFQVTIDGCLHIDTSIFHLYILIQLFLI